MRPLAPRRRLVFFEGEDDDGTLASDLWTNICFFFLVAFAFAVEAERGPDIAGETALARGEATAAPPVVVHVARDPAGTLALRFGGPAAPAVSDGAVLADMVAEARAGAGEAGVPFVVSAAETAAYADLLEAMGRLAAAGVPEVGLAAPAAAVPAPGDGS